LGESLEEMVMARESVREGGERTGKRASGRAWERDRLKILKEELIFL